MVLLFTDCSVPLIVKCPLFGFGVMVTLLLPLFAPAIPVVEQIIFPPNEVSTQVPLLRIHL
jgi:hypothetical protein